MSGLGATEHDMCVFVYVCVRVGVVSPLPYLPSDGLHGPKVARFRLRAARDTPACVKLNIHKHVRTRVQPNLLHCTPLTTMMNKVHASGSLAPSTSTGRSVCPSRLLGRGGGGSESLGAAVGSSVAS